MLNTKHTSQIEIPFVLNLKLFEFGHKIYSKYCKYKEKKLSIHHARRHGNHYYVAIIILIDQSCDIIFLNKGV